LIRKAALADVRSIHRLISEQAREGRMLPRPLSELYSHVRDFTVAVDDSEKVAGCGALHVVWEDLAEIRSLAVQSARQGAGLGTALVDALVEEASIMGISGVFVLTYRPALFERRGFRRIHKNRLPQKIWSDCIRCPKFPECDEIALLHGFVQENAGGMSPLDVHIDE
jgi:amino-acid N-acetyltransferase